MPVISSTSAQAGAAKACTMTGSRPFSLTTAPSTTAEIVRADIVGLRHRMLGRQLIFNNQGEVHIPIISPKIGYFVEAQPSVRCEIDAATSLNMATVVDVGPQVTIRSLYQGKRSVAVSFYAFEEDYFAGRRDEGLLNQIFVVQLDGREPYQLQISAKPGQDVAVRFDNVSAGRHRLRIGEMDPSDGGFTSLWLWVLEFTQPNGLSA